MNDIFEYTFSASDLKMIEKRPEVSNKYTFGKILFVCGSKGMAGAAYLSALSAYRMGAGLCELFIPEENRVILQTLLPEAVVTCYTGADTDLLEERMKRCDAVVIGCGLGKSADSLALVRTVLRVSEVPTVVDADALNLISEHPVLKKYLSGKVITPHFAEMARLLGKKVSEIEVSPKKVCAEFAAETGAVCVLKGRNTVVSDGSERIYVNNSGNSALAKAGSGDLLSGMIAALAARRDAPLPLLDSSTLGVYIHGLAGELAAKKYGEFSPVARDVADSISEIMKSI